MHEAFRVVAGPTDDCWEARVARSAAGTSPSDDALYALEMVTGSIDEDPFILPDTGRIVRRAGPDDLEVVEEGLNFPIGLDFGPDGALYVASPALGGTPGTATIVLLALEGVAVAAATPVAAPECRAAPAA